MITKLIELGNYIGKITREHPSDLPDTLILMRPAATGSHGYIPSSSIRVQGWENLLEITKALTLELNKALRSRSAEAIRLDKPTMDAVANVLETMRLLQETVTEQTKKAEESKP